MKRSIVLPIFFVAGVLTWNAGTACTPEKLEKSTLFRILRHTRWIDEGWGFPVSVQGVSGWNSDCKPSLTADGKYLYFQAAAQNGPPYSPDHLGGIRFNLYVARWNGAQWDSVTHLGPHVNPCSYSCISSDNRILYFTKGSKIWMSERSAAGFGPASVLPYPVNDPDKNVTDRAPFITADGRELYFASQRAGGQGSYDLYVVRWNGAAWDSLTNLGPSVNTRRSETHPAVSPDGQKLYFSNFSGSGGDREAFGDSDLYVCRRQGGGWSEPDLVGPPVNTDLPSCSAFPTADGKLYVGSEVSEGGYGEEDIWLVREKDFEIIRETVTIPGMRGWRNTGELEGAWYIHCLLESADGTIYAGTAPNGDVFRTTNGGISWEKTGNLKNVLRVYSLIESQDHALYAGTYPYGDVFRSTNRGETWEKTADLPGASTVRALIELPNGKLIAGTSPDSSDVGRLFISTNGGASWRLRYTPDIFKGGTHVLFYADKALFCTGRTAGAQILVSPNSGETWNTVTKLPFENDDISLADFYFIYRSSDGALWTGGWAHGPQGAMARSTDLGRTWEAVSEIKPGEVEMAWIFTLVEKEDGLLLAGGHPGPDSVIAETRDNGMTWDYAGTLPSALELLCFLKTADGSIYAGTTPNGDVFKLKSGTEAGRIPESVPFDPILSQNFPNPFNTGTYFHFRLFESAEIRVSIHTISGNEVRTLARGHRRSGDSILYWDGLDSDGLPLPSGMYLCRLHAEYANGSRDRSVRKVMMLK
jgi:photosystem II stability/assembly factor-like uncharacterized protein